MNNKEALVEKCNSEQMCSWLADRTEPAGFRGKGFVKVMTVDSTGKRTGLYGVKYKQERGDDGMLINHCPACGQTPGKYAEDKKA